MERCRAMAQASSSVSFQQLWMTVADSYRCFYNNEVRALTDAGDRWQRVERDAQSRLTN
jgi:hypothetical protein